MEVMWQVTTQKEDTSLNIL